MKHALSRRAALAAGPTVTLATIIGLTRPARAQAVGRKVDADAYSCMAGDPRLTNWVRLIDAGGQQQYARAPTPYTIFPASNEAFAAFPDFIKTLLGYQSSTGTHNAEDAFPDTSRIVQLVRSHVVRGMHYPADVMGKRITVSTIAGTPLEVDGTDPAAVRLSWTAAGNGQPLGARLVGEPVACSNAVVYIVDHIERM